MPLGSIGGVAPNGELDSNQSEAADTVTQRCVAPLAVDERRSAAQPLGAVDHVAGGRGSFCSACRSAALLRVGRLGWAQKRWLVAELASCVPTRASTGVIVCVHQTAISTGGDRTDADGDAMAATLAHRGLWPAALPVADGRAHPGRPGDVDVAPGAAMWFRHGSDPLGRHRSATGRSRYRRVGTDRGKAPYCASVDAQSSNIGCLRRDGPSGVSPS